MVLSNRSFLGPVNIKVLLELLYSFEHMKKKKGSPLYVIIVLNSSLFLVEEPGVSVETEGGRRYRKCCIVDGSRRLRWRTCRELTRVRKGCVESDDLVMSSED